VYVEFFNEKHQLENYLTTADMLLPISVPQKMTKKLEKCWEAAETEKQAVVTVREVRAD
jgi:hypothetical protein